MRFRRPLSYLRKQVSIGLLKWIPAFAGMTKEGRLNNTKALLTSRSYP
jgi:hypothetical protein